MRRICSLLPRCEPVLAAIPSLILKFSAPEYTLHGRQINAHLQIERVIAASHRVCLTTEVGSEAGTSCYSLEGFVQIVDGVSFTYDQRENNRVRRVAMLRHVQPEIRQDTL